MYKSPIEIITTDIHTQIMKQHEDEIYKAVVSIGINVDKQELIRALNYDRCQYSRGYFDGKAEAMEEIVRCKDCKHASINENHPNKPLICYMTRMCGTVRPEWYCADGERKDNEKD